MQAHGITLSCNQYDFARQQVERQGLQGRVSMELRDYRELPKEKSHDKVVSIGMFEHVGLKNLPRYFATALRVLKPSGLFLNHGITSSEPGWGRSVATRFINRHVFPDGELDTISNVMRRMEDAGFEIFDVEGLSPHYALTLRHWVKHLEQRQEQARACRRTHLPRLAALYAGQRHPVRKRRNRHVPDSRRAPQPRPARPAADAARHV